jgi:chromosome segregation ATPase
VAAVPERDEEVRDAASEEAEGLKDRLSRQSEDALGRIAEELIANPVVNAAIGRAFDAREKALQAQEAAMGALGIPSSADVERVTRRLRSVSQRLEGIEDAVDRLDERLEGIEAGVDRLDRSVEASAGAGDVAPAAAIERRLDEIARDIAALREAVSGQGEPVPRAQERFTVTES